MYSGLRWISLPIQLSIFRSSRLRGRVTSLVEDYVLWEEDAFMVQLFSDTLVGS